MNTDQINDTDKKRGFLRQHAWFIGLVLFIIIFRSSFANHYVVPSGSMEPALLVGDRVFVDMSAYGVRIPYTNVVVLPRSEPSPGDIVVFKSPHDGTRLIKRVVATAGQTVELENGKLSINGQSLVLPTASTETIERLGSKGVVLNLADGPGPDIEKTLIPDGKVLVLGDHRGASADGRYFGLVDQAAFYGKAVAVYWRRGQGLVWEKR